MREDVAKIWTDALCDGSYAQGRSHLRSDVLDEDGAAIGQEYCCLGVLTDLYRQQHSGAEWIPFPLRDFSKTVYQFGLEGSTAYLPVEVQEWAEIDSHSGRVPYEPGVPRTSMVGLNDGGSSFLEIADVIKKRVKVL